MTTRFLRSRATIGVRDVATAAAFYERAVGFEVLVIMGQPPNFAMLGAGDVGLGLAKVQRRAAPKFACCYFNVEGVEDLHQRCVEAGARITAGLTVHEWGTYDFVLADPDGNQIAFGEVP